MATHFDQEMRFIDDFGKDSKQEEVGLFRFAI